MAYNIFHLHRADVATFEPTAAGDYTSSVLLPEGAVVTKVVFDELTDLSGGTDIQLFAGPSDTGTALTDAVVTANIATGSVDLASTATAIKLSSTSLLTLKTTGTYTDGSIRIFVEYLAD